MTKWLVGMGDIPPVLSVLSVTHQAAVSRVSTVSVGHRQATLPTRVQEAAMYSDRARELRQCTATKSNGERCQAWAMWDDPQQRCVTHAGRHHTGPIPLVCHLPGREKRAKVQPCTCPAYQWPHRPGGGLCRWPDPPQRRDTTPAGTRHFSFRVRRKRGWR